MAEQVKKLTANDFTNCRDIKDKFLYTKDGYIMGYLKINSYNIDLMTREELELKTNHITAQFEEDRKDWVYFTLPREINLDQYKTDLRSKYQDEFASSGIKKILQEMIKECIDLSSSGENYEHQAYIKLWKKIGTHKEDAERELKERLEEFRVRFTSNGIVTEIMDKQSIIIMCNLFANSMQAPYESIDNESLYETSLYLS